MENLIKLLTVLVWPITLLLVLIIFKRQIIGITDLIQQVEAPGGFKLYLDREKVEKLIKDGARENIPAEELASQIVKSAEVIDTMELRVLRALFDEKGGRLIANYEKYYRNAIDNLIVKGYIEKKGNYFLTEIGHDVTKRYLLNVIEGKNLRSVP